jgi:hypothetical protein
MKLKTCPHGRPIMMNMSYKKLDDFFGRWLNFRDEFATDNIIDIFYFG